MMFLGASSPSTEYLLRLPTWFCIICIELANSSATNSNSLALFFLCLINPHIPVQTLPRSLVGTYTPWRRDSFLFLFVFTTNA